MRKLVVAAALASGMVALAAALAVATHAGASPAEDVQAAKAASARYHSLDQALKDGYSGAGEPCVASPDGAMGIHYVNGALIGDDAIDPLRPEILLYNPAEDGKLKLVAVEYFKVDADQNLATANDRPSLFGQPFNGPMPGHNPTMPVHYDLHVWFWQSNPSGLFAPFNPSLSCATGVGAAQVFATGAEVLPGDTPVPFWPHETGVHVGTSETFADIREDGSYHDPSLGRRVPPGP